MKKRILYLLQRAPYLDDRVTESFDAALVAAAFEQDVSLLFRGDGLQQLLGQQSVTNQRSLAKMLKSLHTYEINAVYVDQADMTQQDLTVADFAIPIEPLTQQAIGELVANHDVVLSG